MAINFAIFFISFIICQNNWSDVTVHASKHSVEYLTPTKMPRQFDAVKIAPLPENKIENNLPRYDFRYYVDDPITGDMKHHAEERLGGNTVGFYSVIDADGFKRTVTYTANDENGFQANVQREPLLNNIVPIIFSTYRNVIPAMEFDSLHSLPILPFVDASRSTFGVSTYTTPVNAIDLLPMHQKSPLVTALDTIYQHQIFDLPLQQLSIEYNQSQREESKQKQQPSLDTQVVQMVSNNESSSYQYHQEQPQQQLQQQQQQQQQQQHLQLHPEDQQLVSPNNTQHQQHNPTDIDIDDSDIVEAPSQKRNRKLH